MNQIHLVVMAGGSGTRFWPRSTSLKPKQLLNLADPRRPESLLENTLDRFEGRVSAAQRWIVTTEKLSAAVNGVAGGATVLAEPQGRNTAPCVYWAARAIAARDPNAMMIVVPADHLVAKPDAFLKTMDAAVEWAATHDDLVTLGVSPTRPETGYGYLRLGAKLDASPKSATQVAAFVEKPNETRAREFLESKEYLWNGGMFVWRVSVILKAFDSLMPEMAREWDQGRGDIRSVYPKLTATSIDFGIMEKAPNVVTFPLDCGWDDLGSWTSFEEVSERIGLTHDVGVVAAGEVIGVDSTGNIIDAPGKYVALLGAKNLVVVDTGPVLMIIDKSRAQDIKKLVELTQKKRPELT